MLYYVKCGHDVTLKFGDIDETFYNSMVSMFASIVEKITAQGDNDLIITWLPALQKEASRVSDVGWGYGDDLRELVGELRGRVDED